jgi:hypothetical protein
VLLRHKWTYRSFRWYFYYSPSEKLKLLVENIHHIVEHALVQHYIGNVYSFSTEFVLLSHLHKCVISIEVLVNLVKNENDTINKGTHFLQDTPCF